MRRIPSDTRCTGRGPGRAARSKSAGLTLVEVAGSTFLTASLLVTSLVAVAAIFRTWAVAGTSADSLALAQQLMNEILGQQYEDPDGEPVFGLEAPESSTDRSLWDDVDDYHGWSSPPEDKNGNVLADYAGWNCSVMVRYASLAAPESAAATDEGLKRIHVTVADPSGRAIVLVGYRSRSGVLEQALDADSTVYTGIEAAAQIGESRLLYGGVDLPNHALDESLR